MSDMSAPKKRIVLQGRFATMEDVNAQIQREEAGTSASVTVSGVNDAAFKDVGAVTYIDVKDISFHDLSTLHEVFRPQVKVDDGLKLGAPIKTVSLKRLEQVHHTESDAYGYGLIIKGARVVRFESLVNSHNTEFDGLTFNTAKEKIRVKSKESKKLNRISD